VAGALCFWRRTGDFLLFARHWFLATASTKNHWRSHAETHAEAMRTCFPPCTHGAHSAHSAQSVGAFDEQATSHSCNTVGPCSWCGPVNAIPVFQSTVLRILLVYREPLVGSAHSRGTPGMGASVFFKMYEMRLNSLFLLVPYLRSAYLLVFSIVSYFWWCLLYRNQLY
jgi:hypothetical protein